MRLPHLRVLAVGACLALGLGGCGAATRPPSPTPADFPGITRVLGPLWIAASDIVSGDAGCDDRHLAPTAISFSASGLDQATPVRMYLYIFRDHDAFERNLGAIDSCARSYVGDSAGYEKIAVSPYVIAGQGPWSPTFTSTLTQALTEAAGSGG